MQNGLCSLAYLSRSRIAATGAELDREVASIMAVSRRNNQRRGLTGALLVGRSVFAQVLEGDSNRLAEAFGVIQCDPRHCDVVVLHFKPIRMRAFAGWSLARIDTPTSTAAQVIVTCLGSDQAAIDSGQSGRDLVALMVDLVQGARLPGTRVGGAG